MPGNRCTFVANIRLTPLWLLRYLSRGFESRLGHLTFSSICSVYIDRHIRVDLSDDDNMFEICRVT